MAYGLMPSQTAACPDAKQMYINRLFCYAYKFTILTNGLGIVQHIAFIDDDSFKPAHPEMPVEKKADSPDEDKSIGDIPSLVFVLTDYSSLHPAFHPDIFLAIHPLIPLIFTTHCSPTFIFQEPSFLTIHRIKVL